MKWAYIKELLSVVQRNYEKNEINQPPYLIHRKEDMMICVLSGESVYNIGGDALHLHAGSVLYIPRGTTYTRVVCDDSYRTVFVYFYFDGEPHAHRLFNQVEGIELGFIRLYKKWITKSPAFNLECMSILYGLYATLLTAGELYSPSQKMLEGAVKRISECFTENTLTVSTLAKDTGVSEVHFRRCFKAAYGVSPIEYINALKLSHAKELLQYSTESVESVSFRSGFADPSYFSRLFKQKTGFTPTEYRESTRR